MKYALVINHDECFAPSALRGFFERSQTLPEKIFIVGRYTTTESQISRLKYQVANFVFLGPVFCFNFIVGTAFKKYILRDPNHHFDLMLKDFKLNYQYIEDVNSVDFIKEAHDLESKVIFNIASQIYHKSTINNIPQTIYNIHPGCLQTNRGRYPAFWGAYKNLPNRLSCHKITEKIDAGETLAVLALPDPKKKTPAELTKQYAEHLPEIMEISLINLEFSTVRYLGASKKGRYYPRPDIEDLMQYLFFRLFPFSEKYLET